MGHTTIEVSSPINSETLTYKDLFRLHAQKAGLSMDNLTQQLRNLKSTLLRFLLYCGKTLNDPIGKEFTIDLAEKTESYFSSAGLSRSTIPSQRSHLRSLQCSHAELLKQYAVPDNFAGALNHFIDASGESLRRISRKSKVPVAVLSSWANNEKVPAKNTKIPDVEKALSVPAGTLMSLLPKKQKKTPLTCLSDYGSKLGTLIRLKYFLKEFPPIVEKQWGSLLDFKTAVILPEGKIRHKNGKWKVGAASEGVKMKKDYIRGFLGYLTLPPNADIPGHNGKGYKLEQLDMVLFLDTRLVEDFLKFKKIRSDGYNAYHLSFLAFLCSLCHPDHGFFIQYTELFDSFIKEDLIVQIQKAHERYSSIKKQLEPNTKQTRDPAEGCQNIINLDHPLDILIGIAESARIYATTRWHGYPITSRVAVSLRDSLLLNMLTTNPLRQKNYRRMTWRADNTGHLRKSNDGSWWLEVPKEEFKNEHGAAGDHDYRVMVNQSLWPLIEDYLWKYRPILLGGKNSDILFLTRTAKPLSSNDVARIIRIYTHSFCDNPTQGFGPHAYRHIIATDYLKNHPDGFQVVANILHDSLNTVMDNYAHLKVHDGFKHWDKYFNNRKSTVESMKEAA